MTTQRFKSVLVVTEISSHPTLCGTIRGGQCRHFKPIYRRGGIGHNGKRIRRVAYHTCNLYEERLEKTAHYWCPFKCQACKDGEDW